MEPIRVLQVVTIMNRGGLETMLMNYYRQMDRRKIQFDFMVHRLEEGHYDQEINEMGGRIYTMPSIRPGNYRNYYKQLEAFFEKHREYKVVHSHVNENSSFVLRAAKRAGIPCRIAHSHLSDLGFDLKLPFRIYARLQMKKNPSEYFACSENAGRWLFGKEAANSKKIKVLNNAVNVEQFKYNESIRIKVRKQLGIENQLVIGHIGRFNKQKNHDFLINIFHSLQRKYPNSLLLLAGEGDLLGVIREKVSRLNLRSQVKFLGVRSDVPELMQAFDLFLFPSLFEGLPVVLVEAQAAGLQCIVSNTITRESDVTGRVEFVSLNKTPEEWAESILQTSYDHADTSSQLQKNGYDSSTMAYWLWEFYKQHYEQPAF